MAWILLSSRASQWHTLSMAFEGPASRISQLGGIHLVFRQSQVCVQAPGSFLVVQNSSLQREGNDK